MKVIRKPLFWIISVIVVAWAVILGIYTEIAISFAWLSIAIAVFFASRSLYVASESLKLTRSAIRPFLSVQTGDVHAAISDIEVLIKFQVKNTGSIPGEIVTMTINEFDSNEDVTIDNESAKYPGVMESPEQPLIFPNSSMNLEHVLDISGRFGKEVLKAIRGGKIKLRYIIKYRSMNIEYLTVQTEQITRSDDNTLTRRPISPQYWT